MYLQCSYQWGSWFNTTSIQDDSNIYSSIIELTFISVLNNGHYVTYYNLLHTFDMEMLMNQRTQLDFFPWHVFIKADPISLTWCLFLRFVEWVPAPALASCLDTPVRGAKLTRIASSKFCTGRHLQYYNQTIDLLGELRDSDDEDEPKKKKKKTDKVFSGETRPLVDCVDASRILFKISKIFPDMVEKTKVLSFTIPVSDSTNVLSLECESKNQLKLIATLITAIMNLDTGDHIILEGLPLFTRLDWNMHNINTFIGSWKYSWKISPPTGIGNFMRRWPHRKKGGCKIAYEYLKCPW